VVVFCQSMRNPGALADASAAAKFDAVGGDRLTDRETDTGALGAPANGEYLLREPASGTATLPAASREVRGLIAFSPHALQSSAKRTATRERVRQHITERIKRNNPNPPLPSNQRNEMRAENPGFPGVARLVPPGAGGADEIVFPISVGTTPDTTMIPTDGPPPPPPPWPPVDPFPP
jgi:hypothetical protein